MTEDVELPARSDALWDRLDRPWLTWVVAGLLVAFSAMALLAWRNPASPVWYALTCAVAALAAVALLLDAAAFHRRGWVFRVVTVVASRVGGAR